MTEEPESIVPRCLRRLDEKTDRIEDKLDDLAGDAKVLKGHMAGSLQTEMIQDPTIARIQARLDRTERRLDLADG